MAGYTNKLKLTLWVSAVYVLSFICYVPTLLEQNGIIIPNGLLYLKYLYVCIPAMAAIFLLIGVRADPQAPEQPAGAEFFMVLVNKPVSL